MDKYDIAKVCHEVNRSFCISMGDTSQPTWEDAPAWQKEACMFAVELHLNNDLGPEATHDHWMLQKLESGWKYGEVKDANAKTHPCLIPFDELSSNEKAKDYLIRQVIHSLKNYLQPRIY